MKISPSRVAAFDVLFRIENDRAFSSVLLPSSTQNLSDADRGLCYELVLGVLRRQIYLDRVIDHFTKGKRLDLAVRLALRLGAYQMLFLDKVPAYSAINESVNLVQRARKTSAKGMVNAVLRKLGDGAPKLSFGNELEQVSVETSHPAWLIERWIEQFGPARARTIAEANNSVPRHGVRLTRKGFGSSHLAGLPESEFVNGCFFAEAIDKALRSAADAGEIYFQDEASQLVGQAVVRKKAARILDVCAAPGGKTSQIAAGLASPETDLLVAGDLHTARVRLLRSTCDKQGAEFVKVLMYDAAAAIPLEAAAFDVVLLDAPCSGTGTIRHNPEIRYSLTENDLEELRKKQLAILTNASKLVRLNGRLIYSTCSLQVEENEDVCREFLGSDLGFERKVPDIPARFRTREGFGRTFPDRDGMDGFFVAEFERVVQ